MKQKTGLRAQLLFLMHSQVVSTASFFLTAREEVALCSVSHITDIAWIYGEDKEICAYLFTDAAEPLLIPSITVSELTYLFVQNLVA